MCVHVAVLHHYTVRFVITGNFLIVAQIELKHVGDN